MKLLFSFRVFLPLKNGVEEDAPRICIMRLGVYDPSKYHLGDLIKVALMVTEILMLEDDNFTVSGEVGSLYRHSVQDRIIMIIIIAESIYFIK